MVTHDKSLTIDEFWDYTHRPEHQERRFELVHGAVIEMSPSSLIPSMIAARFVRYLGAFVDDHDLGYVTGADGGYVLSAATVFAPDVGFISKALLPELPPRYVPHAPELAVEVLSPTDNVTDLHSKALTYLAHGTKLVWIVYPETKTVDVYRPNPEAQNSAIVTRYDQNAVLNGGDVLPEFSLKLADIFRE